MTPCLFYASTRPCPSPGRREKKPSTACPLISGDCSRAAWQKQEEDSTFPARLLGERVFAVMRCEVFRRGITNMPGRRGATAPVPDESSHRLKLPWELGFSIFPNQRPRRPLHVPKVTSPSSSEQPTNDAKAPPPHELAAHRCQDCWQAEDGIRHS